MKAVDRKGCRPKAVDRKGLTCEGCRPQGLSASPAKAAVERKAAIDLIVYRPHRPIALTGDSPTRSTLNPKP